MPEGSGIRRTVAMVVNSPWTGDGAKSLHMRSVFICAYKFFVLDFSALVFSACFIF